MTDTEYEAIGRNTTKLKPMRLKYGHVYLWVEGPFGNECVIPSDLIRRMSTYDPPGPDDQCGIAEFPTEQAAYVALGKAAYEVDIGAVDASQCPRCEGSGVYSRLGEPTKDCAVCDGTGRIAPDVKACEVCGYDICVCHTLTDDSVSGTTQDHPSNPADRTGL